MKGFQVHKYELLRLEKAGNRDDFDAVAVRTFDQLLTIGLHVSDEVHIWRLNEVRRVLARVDVLKVQSLLGGVYDEWVDVLERVNSKSIRCGRADVSHL